MARKTVKKKKPVAKRRAKRVAVATPIVAPSIEFDLMLQSITELYPNDPTNPGLAIAWLPSSRTFYASVHRFRGRMGNEPYTVFKGYGPTAFHCMRELLDKWSRHINPPMNATQTLRGLRGATKTH
jgi:hypothetical protein